MTKGGDLGYNDRDYLQQCNMLLLSTSSLGGYGLDHIFSICKENGILGIDLAMEYDNLDHWDIDYIKSLIKKYQVTVKTVTAPARDMTEEIVNDIIVLSKKIGAELVTFSPPHISDKKTRWFKEYLPMIGRKGGIDISVQNVEPKYIFFVIPEYKNATFEKLKEITGKTTLNISGVDANTGVDILKAQAILGASLKNILLCDKSETKTGLLPGGKRGKVSHLPLESFLMQMKTGGYQGFFTIKVHPESMEVGDIEKVRRSLEDSKVYFDKYFEKFEG